MCLITKFWIKLLDFFFAFVSSWKVWILGPRALKHPFPLYYMLGSTPFCFLLHPPPFLQVEDVIFTWISRGVLNDTIRRYFVYFSWNCLDEINCWYMILFCNPRNFTGGRCDFHLKIERCLKRNNDKIFWSIFTVWKLWITERR